MGMIIAGIVLIVVVVFSGIVLGFMSAAAILFWAVICSALNTLLPSVTKWQRYWTLLPYLAGSTVVTYVTVLDLESGQRMGDAQRAPLPYAKEVALVAEVIVVLAFLAGAGLVVAYIHYVTPRRPRTSMSSRDER